MTTELETHVGTGLVWDDTGKLIGADFGTGAGEVCEGDDVRLSDDRTASGLRSLTTIVSIATAAAPTAGQVLQAINGTSAQWATLAGGPATQITETSGPTTLNVVNILDLQLTRRNAGNFEGVTPSATLVGLGNVSNDAQLKRAALDFASFTAKATPVGGDVVLIEDSAAAGAKKYSTITQILAVGPAAHAASHLPGGSDALTTAAAGAIQPDDSAAVGTAASFARSDHKHSIVAAAPGSILPDDVAAEGVATSFARSDHTHAITAAVAGTIQPDDSAAEGAATSFARSDHRHAIVAAAASANPPGSANAEGASTSFARADHTHALASFGSTSGTFAEGNDSRFAVFPTFYFYADQMDNPVTSDWAVNSLAAASACTNNSGLTVRRFANATENGIGVDFPIPAGATNVVFGFTSRAETTPAGTVAVIPRVYVRELNATVESWSAGTDLTALSFGTNENWEDDTQTVSLATLSLVVGRKVQLELTRRGSDGSDTLTTDWTLYMFSVGFT